MKLNINYLFIVYVFVCGLFAGFLHKVLDINNAKVFDSYYFLLMIIAISLCSILFNESKFIHLLKNILLTGITVCAVASIVFYILDKANYYFTFEMEGYTWVGLYGMIKILIYLFISSVVGTILWGLKLLVIRLTSR
ncbi:hypothetical protein [Anaerobacterium chartisolvens]|nr:hypothetical protein [Anaerobacterium chartisolvens]